MINDGTHGGGVKNENSLVYFPPPYTPIHPPSTTFTLHAVVLPLVRRVSVERAKGKEIQTKVCLKGEGEGEGVCVWGGREQRCVTVVGMGPMLRHGAQSVVFYFFILL